MSRTIISTIVIAATSFVVFGQAAQAGDWNRRSAGHGPAYGYAQPVPRHYAPPAAYYQPPHRDRTGERIAKGVAIGVGALILGSILANESRRHNDGYGY